MRTRLFLVVAILVAGISSPYQTDAQVRRASDDPLRHGHALLIGNSRYLDRSWAQLDDIPLQLDALQRGLQGHFDTIQVKQNLETEQLRQTIHSFVRTYGNDSNARLFIYYAGHGYTELIRQRNENRGYITGINTPKIDFTQQSFDAARLLAISMAEIRAPLEDVLAKSILFVFDSCFAGTIFTTRRPNDPPRPHTADVFERLSEKQARDFITAGTANETVPAHSPIPTLFLEALNGAADRYQHGVISTADIHQYLFDRTSRIRDFKLTPQVGKLPNPAFAEGTFLFRVINSTQRVGSEGERSQAIPLGLAAEQDLVQAKRFFDAQDYDGARPFFMRAANAGNAEAMMYLGHIYDVGRGVSVDYGQARQWYEKAAAAGEAMAMTRLGELYLKGHGVPQDYGQARQWFEKAVKAGEALAMVNLGWLYEEGRGVPWDAGQARQWYEKAAAAGEAMAMTRLGELYERGRLDYEQLRPSSKKGLRGIPPPPQPDYGQARQWYEKAAAAGEATAMTRLGWLYEVGWGVPQDYGQARQWYEKAASYGDIMAKERLQELSKGSDHRVINPFSTPPK
jgi:TPR repeat protein